jgi:hypothetical protein
MGLEFDFIIEETEDGVRVSIDPESLQLGGMSAREAAARIAALLADLDAAGYQVQIEQAAGGGEE